ncbi:MAG: hypothetical protein ACTSQG_10640 [Promethearchaeota archaeon]
MAKRNKDKNLISAMIISLLFVITFVNNLFGFKDLLNTQPDVWIAISVLVGFIVLKLIK